MDVRLFRSRVYSMGLVTLFLAYAAVYGVLLVITQYLQNIRDESVEAAGLIMAPLAVSILIFSPIAGRLVARIGPRLPVLSSIWQ